MKNVSKIGGNAAMYLSDFWQCIGGSMHNGAVRGETDGRDHGGRVR